MQRRITRLLGERYEQVLAEHDEIIEAFRQKDADRARQAIVNHARLAKEFIDSIYY
jgi:DNA-binding GntR family transcriptional regulator